MQIFVMNLDRAPERLAHMTTLFGGLGLPFTRVPAVDGKSLAAAEANRWIGGEPKFYPLGPGEIGCFLSHRECWERVVRDGLDHAAIFEDDMLMGADADAVLSDSGWIPADADLVKLDTACRNTVVDRHIAAVAGHHSVTRLREAHAGGGAYIVSRAGAQKLLGLSRSFCDPVDQFLFNPVSAVFQVAVIYQMTPALCIEMGVAGLAADASLGSALSPERRRHRRAGWEKVTRELERPFEQATGLVKGALINLRGKWRWGRIPYR
jgi:glycosyl transferase, family 25